MKAAVIHSIDEPPCYEDFPDPQTMQDEVLVRIEATSLHPLVKARAAGLDPDELPHEHHDVTLDYLWGRPADVLLARLAQPGRGGTAARTRYLQLGERDGGTGALTADTLRGTGLEMLGSGGRQRGH